MFRVKWREYIKTGYVLTREEVYNVDSERDALLEFYLMLVGKEGESYLIKDYINPKLENVSAEDIMEALRFAIQTGYVHKVEILEVEPVGGD